MANKETRIVKSNTFEEFRQKSNDISLHLGDNEQLNNNLSDKTFIFDDVSSGSTIFSDTDDNNKTQIFEIKPEEALDNTGGYIILKNSPTVTGFTEGQTLLQVDRKAIEGFTTPSTITITDHGFKHGQQIIIAGSAGVVGLNDNHYIHFIDADTFKLFSDQSLTTERSFTGTLVTNGTAHAPSNNYSATIVSVSSSKILVKNSVNIFDASLDIECTISGTTSTIGNTDIERIIIEAYPVGVVRVYINSIEINQNVEAGGFHVANYQGNIPLSNAPTVTEFTEGSIIYQGADLATSTFSGTVLSASSTYLKLKNYTGTFNNSAVIKLDGSTATISDTDHENLIYKDISFGHAIELNTPATLDDNIKIYAPSIVDAVNELQDDVGVTENLQTEATNLTDAVNEIEAVFDASTFEISAGINNFDVTSGEFTLDSSADIILDAGTDEILLKAGDDGQFGALVNTSSDIIIKSGTTTMLTGDGSDATFANDVTVTRDVNINRNLDVDGNTTLDGTTIDGNLDLNGNQDTSGTLDVHGATELNDTLGVDGDVRIGSGGDSKFNITSATGNTEIQGTLEVNSTSGVDGDFRVGSGGASNFVVTASTGSTQIAADLNVDGLTTLDGTTIDGSLDLNGSADISTNATIHGNLDVDGLTTLDNTEIEGTLSQTGNVTIVGNVQQNGILDIGTLDAKFTDRNNVFAALNELHDEMGTANIAGTNTAAAGLTDLTSAINAIDSEIGNVSAYESGIYGDTTVSDVLVKLQNGMVDNDDEISVLQTEVGNTVTFSTLLALAQMDSSFFYTNDDGLQVTDISNALRFMVGTAYILSPSDGLIKSNVGPDASMRAAINRHQQELFGFYDTSTYTSSRTLNDLVTADKTCIVDAINSLDGAVVKLQSNTEQDIESELTFTGDIKIKKDGENTGEMTFETGTTLNLTSATLLLPGNSSGVNTLTAGFVNMDGEVPQMGLSVERDHITGIDNSAVKIQWNEEHVDGTSDNKLSRGWQLVGLNDTGIGDTTDIVTFYNAKELITNNTESGINVTWDATTETFDFNVDDFTVTLGTGPISGSFTINNLNGTTFNTTLDNNSVALGTHTTGNYVATAGGTNNEITVSGGIGENRDLTISLPNDLRVPDKLTVKSTTTGNTAGAGALVVEGGGYIEKDFVINGNLTVIGTSQQSTIQQITATSTLALTGSELTTSPSTGGFGLEVGPITSPSGVASNVTGDHSLVYNYATDQWEADGSLILSAASIGSPTVNSHNLPIGKNLNVIQGEGINVATTNTATDITLTIENTKEGYLGWNLYTQNVNRGKINDNEIVDFFGDTAITVEYAYGMSNALNRVIIDHDDIGAGSAIYGRTGAEDGQYIKSISVNAQGHVLAVTSDNFDNRYDKYNNWKLYVNDTLAKTVSSGNRIGIEDGNGIIVQATGSHSGDVLISHANTSSASSQNNALSNTKFIKNITLDDFGHITAVDSDDVPQYTHPSFDGDDINIDTGILSGATVISDLDFNITTNNQGHVTDANGVVTTRNLTLADLGYTGDNIADYYNKWTAKVGSDTFDVTAHETVEWAAGNSGISVAKATGQKITISHADTSTVGSTNNSGNTFIQDIEVDTYGHITGINSSSVTVGNGTLTVKGGTGISGSGNFTANQTTSKTITLSHADTSSVATLDVDNSGNRFIQDLKLEFDQFGHVTDYLVSSKTVTVGNGKLTLNTSGNGISGSTSFYANQTSATTFTVTSNATANATKDTIAYRDGHGDLHCRLLRPTHATDNASVGYIMTQVEKGVGKNNSIRPSTPAQVKSAMGLDGVAADEDVTFKYITSAGMYSTGNIQIHNTGPTIYLRDTNHRSSMIHQNSNLFFVLRGSGNASTTWEKLHNKYPMTIDMETNNASFGGQIEARTDIIAYASDERLKENIVPIPNALEKVSQLKGCTFDWRDKVDEVGFTPTNRKNDVGLIAQDVEDVLPQLVTLAPFDKYIPDPDSKEDESHLMGTSRSGEDYKTVKYDRIVALLVEAIKELKAEVDELKANK